MDGEISQLTKPPAREYAKYHLEKTGMAVEHFPDYGPREHDFHTHDFIEMLFVCKGHLRHIISECFFDERPGSLAIINFNQFHSFIADKERVETINVYWDTELYPLPNLPEPLESRLHELIPLHPKFGHRLNRVQHLVFRDPKKAALLLKMILNEQETNEPGSSTAIESLYRAFVIELCRAAESVKTTSSFNSRIEDVRIYLEKHFTEPIRLHELCKMTGLSDASLCRKFKEHTGLTTGNYLKQRRLAAALRQLRSTNDKITAICFDCGFPDVSHFNRTFRDSFNCSPGEYRRKHS